MMRAAGEPADIATALRQRASIDQHLGRTADALLDLREAGTFIDHIVDPDLRRIALGESLLAEGVIRSEADSGSALAALDRALAFLASTNYRALLPSLYLARARVLLRQGADEEGFRSLESGIAECERQRPTVAPDRRVSWFGRSQDLYSEMVRLQLRRGNPVAALTYVERARARALLDMVVRPDGDVPPPPRTTAQDLLDATQLRSELPSGVWVIEYRIDGRELQIWAISRDALVFRRTPVDVNALRSTPGRLAEAVRLRSEVDFAAAASFGYRSLMAPVRDLVHRAAWLVLVPDPAFAAMPFGALRDPSTRHYLVESLPIVVAPSANVFVRCQRRAEALSRGVASPLLALGGPRFRADLFPSLPPLPGAIGEAQAVAAGFKHPRLLVDAAATKPAFLSAAPRSWIVHFAGHALRNEVNPGYSSLLFAPTAEPGDAGVFYAHELSGHRFEHTRLVVLSGCETAKGTGSSSESALGLSIAFLAAGVPAVIGSLWSADDSASTALFTGFYGYLAAGDTPAFALRRAVLDLRSSPQPAFRSPAAWANFELIGGNGNPVTP
jgi:CHAT domain-containing protein